MLDTVTGKQDAAADQIVLLDAWGAPTGAVAMAATHRDRPCLGLAFACLVVGAGRRVLVVRGPRVAGAAGPAEAP